MGSEIIYPIGIGIMWEMVILIGPSLTYVLIFRFRNKSAFCRIALRAILCCSAVLLLAPSVLGATASAILLPAAVTGAFQPPSDGFIGAGLVIGADALLIGAWWGLAKLFRHLNRSLDRSTLT